MSKSKKSAAVAPNYSKEQEQIIRDHAPMNLEKARVLAAQFDKSVQSVIAKCYHLEVEYTAAEKAAKRPTKQTKSDLVARIAKDIDRNVDGLEKATTRALLNLINGIEHLVHADASE